MLIKADGNWVNILRFALKLYKSNIQPAINMTPFDTSNIPRKVAYYIGVNKLKPKDKSGW